MTAPYHFLQKRWVIDYLQATDNEILFDENDYRFLNLSTTVCGCLPRPTKWAGRLSPHFWISLLAWRLGRMIWRFGGAMTFHLWQLLRHLAYARSLPDTEMPSSCGNFALAFSSRAVDVINASSVPGFKACWITFPWVAIDRFPADATRIDAFSLLSTKDLLLAFRHAVCATRALSHRKGADKWLLHSYTAFRWFAARAALEKLGGTLYMAEHYDRWAILADGVILARLRKTDKTAQLALIQHGRVEGLSDDAQAPQFHLALKRRLKAVSALYVYDKMSEGIFKESILSSGCVERGVRVNYFRPSIVLHDEPGLPKDRINILFVGHPACEALHVFLLEKLQKKFVFTAFYKPHPQMQMSAELAALDWKVITEKSHFPRVDFLVSYPSTLVVEYAASGIPAAVHPLDLPVRNCHAFETEVIAHIQRHA